MSDDIETAPEGEMPLPLSADQNVVPRGADGDPLPHPDAVRMIEKESYERVIEGLKMMADACAHLAKLDIKHGHVWKDVGKRTDQIRLDCAELGAMDLVMKQQETKEVRGDPVDWREARDRFMYALRQAAGGMRQLATCFRGDFRWSLRAQELDRAHVFFRALLRGHPHKAPPQRKLILPPGYQRQ